MTRVVIADDHTLLRESLSKAIRSQAGFEVVAEVARGDEVAAVVQRTEPDLLLLDIAMPGADGLQVAAELRGEWPDLKILFVSMHDDDMSLRRAIALNAAGFVSKTASIDELVGAVRTVAAGDSYLSPHVAKRVMDLVAGRGRSPGHTLTERELEILELLATGARPADIAGKLFLSVKTVKNHLTSIYAKLGVATGAQAVAEAYRLGLVAGGPAREGT